MNRYTMRAIRSILPIAVCLALASNSGALNSFSEAKKAFEAENYVAAEELINSLKKSELSSKEALESAYMAAKAALKNRDKDAVQKLEGFLEQYPVSAYKVAVTYLIGQGYFYRGEYTTAIDKLLEVDSETLSSQDQAYYYYLLGISYVKTDQYKKALAPLQVVLEQPGEYQSGAIYYKGYALYALKEYNEAYPLFVKVENTSPYREGAAYYLAQIYYQQKKYAAALERSTQLLSNHLETIYTGEMLRIAGESSYALSEREKAKTYLERYLAENPVDAVRSSVLHFGEVCFELGDYASAIKYLSRITSPTDSIAQAAYYYLGNCYVKTNEMKNAQLAYQHAANSNFNRVIQEKALYNYAMAIHQTAYSPFDESIGVFERFLNLFPHSSYTDKINTYLVEVYLSTRNYAAALASIAHIHAPSQKVLAAKQRITTLLGIEQIANNELKSALESLNSAIKQGSYDKEALAQAYFWRGECYYRLENFQAAASDFNHFYNTAPASLQEGKVTAAYNSGYCQFKLHNFDKAAEWFNKFTVNQHIGNGRALIDAYNRLGDCYFYNRLFDKANASYKLAYNLSPDAGDYATYQMGFISGLQQRYADKINAMDKVIQTYPHSEWYDDALYEKGRTQQLTKDYPRAILTFERLQLEFPQSAYARTAGVMLGMIHYNNNNIERAIEAYKKVIEQYPGSEEARVATEDLKGIYVDRNEVSVYAQYIRSVAGAVPFESSQQDSLTFFAAEKLFLQHADKSSKENLTRYLQTFEKGAFATQAHHYLANYYEDNRDTTNAIVHYQAVLTYPDVPQGNEALEALANLLMGEKKYAEARKYYGVLEIKSASAAQTLAAQLGVLRSSVALQDDNEVVLTGKKLLEKEKLTNEQTNEVRLAYAKAKMNLKEYPEAVKELQKLALDTRNVYGAEAQYLIAQHLFEMGKEAESEKQINSFIDKGTPHQYWMARVFVLLSDIYLKQGDEFQAKQYLLSLKNNYKGKDDIEEMITTRLKAFR